MMKPEFEMYEHVRIPHKNVTGQIIHISTGKYDGRYYYTVESDVQGYVDDPDAYPCEWPEYECTDDRLERI